MAKRRTPPPAPAPIEGPFVLGAVPGTTPGTWIRVWNERMPRSRLVLRPIAYATQRDALLAPDDGPDAERRLDCALVRLPIDNADLHVIRLYDEVPVVVASAESHLMAADELDVGDLAGEVLIVPQDDVLGMRGGGFDAPGTVAPAFDPPDDTEQAIAIAASGIGCLIVPMSLARLHHRKDASYRPLRNGPVSTVALAWPADRTTPAVDAFIGIVRGRTPNSSR